MHVVKLISKHIHTCVRTYTWQRSILKFSAQLHIHTLYRKKENIYKNNIFLHIDYNYNTLFISPFPLLYVGKVNSFFFFWSGVGVCMYVWVVFIVEKLCMYVGKGQKYIKNVFVQERLGCLGWRWIYIVCFIILSTVCMYVCMSAVAEAFILRRQSRNQSSRINLHNTYIQYG